MGVGAVVVGMMAGPGFVDVGAGTGTAVIFGGERCGARAAATRDAWDSWGERAAAAAAACCA